MRKALTILMVLVLSAVVLFFAVCVSVRTEKAAAVPGTPITRFPADTRRAVGWDTYAASADGRTLAFSYYSGPPPCSIADGVEVEETHSAVRVTIFQRDESGGQPCILIAQHKSASVTLASPVGTRRVVDGARS